MIEPKILTNSIDTIKNELFVGVIGKNEFLELLDKDLIQNKENIALISIHDPDADLHSDNILEGFGSVLQIKFWDIEEDIGNYKSISKEQGKELKDYIIKNYDKKFLIHCHAGQSRSAGVALATECILNHNANRYDFQTSYSALKAHPTDRYSPNFTIYDCILGDL